jgi:hypothetical protein
MEETMRPITKTIICGLAAFAMYACSSENTTGPEQSLSTASNNNGNAQRIQIDLPDSTKETLESWLEVRPLNENIAVDYWCHPENPEDPMWCLPHRLQLESGKVLNFYGGQSDRITCELEQDTLSYSTYRNDSIVTKRLSHNLVNSIPDVAAEFKDSCETEGGTFVEEKEGSMECEVKVEPCDGESCPVGIYPTYMDPNWRLFATKAIEPCRTFSSK